MVIPKKPRDPGMRRIVAAFDVAAAGAPRRFRSDLAKALARSRKDRDRESFVLALVKSATLAERRLAAALESADRRLKRRAKAIGGLDGVLGAAGDLSRGVARIEMISLQFSAEMTEGLSVLKGAGFGGEPLLTTLQLRAVSHVYITPINLGLILTSHVPGSPTAWIAITGSAPAGSAVTVVLACGGVQQTLHTTSDGIGTWKVSATVTLSGSSTCIVTATAGTGSATGSITTQIHIP
jgi:hypothetical protein